MVALQLDYSVTRAFRWRWFAPMAFLGALVAIAFLVVINVALTGYETINIFNGDFNYTQTNPMLQFIPTLAHKAGTLCDSHLFNIGDSFVTNYSIFQWVIEAIDTPNAGDSGIDYKGTDLKDCDVASVFLHGDIRTWSVDYTALIACNHTGVLEITAKASFSQSSLPGRRQAPLLGATRSSGDPRAKVLDRLSQIATVDIAQRLYSSMLLSNNTTPAILSLQADFEHCPASLGTSAPCANQVPKFNITFAAAVFPDARLISHTLNQPTSEDNPAVIDSSTEGPLANIVQLIYASARIDLGNPSPNNFILNPAASNQTLVQTFPRTSFVPEVRSELFDQWTTHKGIENLDQYRPVTVGQPANIRVTYLCRSQKKKAAGSLFISVLVATLSMFSAGWAAFMLIATYFAKRSHDANHCDAHLADSSPMSYKEGAHDHALRRRVSDDKIYDGVAT